MGTFLRFYTFLLKNKGGIFTEKELLNKYNDLQKEIKQITDRIEKLKKERCKTKKHDIVKGSCTQFPYLKRSIHIDENDVTTENKLLLNEVLDFEIKELNKRLKQALEMAKSIIDFINSIEDNYIRNILNYRIIENMTWLKVAKTMGEGYSESSVRMAYERFMKTQKSA